MEEPCPNKCLPHTRYGMPVSFRVLLLDSIGFCPANGGHWRQPDICQRNDSNSEDLRPWYWCQSLQVKGGTVKRMEQKCVWLSSFTDVFSSYLRTIKTLLLDRAWLQRSTELVADKLDSLIQKLTRIVLIEKSTQSAKVTRIGQWQCSVKRNWWKTGLWGCRTN